MLGQQGFENCPSKPVFALAEVRIAPRLTQEHSTLGAQVTERGVFF